MPARNSDQIAADNAAESAVDALLKAYNRKPVIAGGTQVGYSIVAYSVKIDDDGEVAEEWTDIFTSHGMLLPMAKGLLELGMENVVSDDDDDD